MMPAGQLRQVRFWLLIFMTGLIISGLTAIPIQWEIDQIKHVIDTRRGCMTSRRDWSIG